MSEFKEYVSPFTTHRFECTCSSFDHNVRWEVDDEMGTISLSLPLNHWRKWWERIPLAVKYIFGRTERYGNYDTVQLNPNDYGRIRNLLEESERKIREFHSHD